MTSRGVASTFCVLAAHDEQLWQPGQEGAPHDLGVGVAAQLSADQVEGEGRQLLHPDQSHLILLALPLPLRLQLIVHLQAKKPSGPSLIWGLEDMT